MSTRTPFRARNHTYTSNILGDGNNDPISRVLTYNYEPILAVTRTRIHAQGTAGARHRSEHEANRITHRGIKEQVYAGLISVPE